MLQKVAFEELKNYWIEEVKRSAPPKIKLFVVGNEVDLVNKIEVPFEEAKKLANQIGVKLFYVSAKTNQGINELLMR